MARRTLLISASILLAALGTALIWLYVQGAENRAQQDANLVPVLFLTKRVNAGQSPASAVKSGQLPESDAGGAVRNLDELGSQTLSINAVAVQVLLKSMLGTSANDTGRFSKNGVVALSISDPNRVPADLQPGDTVDIFALGKGGARIVLSDITVRTVGPARVTTEAATAANGTVQNGAIAPSIVGLDIKDAETAKILYDTVAQGESFALYLHNPPAK